MIIRNTKTGACRHVPNPKGGEAVRLLPEEVIEHISGGEGGNGTSNDGGPAFPHAEVESRHNPDAPYEMTGIESKTVGGMTMRDYFAAKAMQAIIAGNGADESVTSRDGAVGVAKDAYGIADAMLEVRDA